MMVGNRVSVMTVVSISLVMMAMNLMSVEAILMMVSC